MEYVNKTRKECDKMQKIGYENIFNENIKGINGTNHEFDAYDLIYEFINEEILSKYDCLTTCHLEREGEENFKEYYVRHNDNMSEVSEIIELQLKVIREIREYCIENNIKKEYDEILVMVTREAPA